MVIAFQIILLFVILLGVIGIVGEKDDKDLRQILGAVAVAGMIAFIVSVMWL